MDKGTILDHIDEIKGREVFYLEEELGRKLSEEEMKKVDKFYTDYKKNYPNVRDITIDDIK